MKIYNIDSLNFSKFIELAKIVSYIGMIYENRTLNFKQQTDFAF